MSSWGMGGDDSDGGCGGYEEVGGSDSEPAGACGLEVGGLRPDGWILSAGFELPLNAEVDEEVAPHSAAANSVEDDTCPHGEADEEPAGAPGGGDVEHDPDLEAKLWRESQARVENMSQAEIDAIVSNGRPGRSFAIPSTFSTREGSFTQTREGNLEFDPHHG